MSNAILKALMPSAEQIEQAKMAQRLARWLTHKLGGLTGHEYGFLTRIIEDGAVSQSEWEWLRDIEKREPLKPPF